MSLETALNNQPGAYDRICKFGPWFAQQSEDDRNAIIRAFENREITHRHIWKTLKTAGCPSAESSIRTHRLAECGYCERTNYGLHV